MPARTDSELLEGWTAGDPQAGLLLFQRHFPIVRRFFRNKADNDIEDLVQATFLACAEARHRYRGDASFKTFLLAIARHQLFEHYRRVTKQSVLDFNAQSLRDLGTSPSAVIARQQAERALGRALEAIPLDLQIALELAYWEGMDGPAIAAVLEIPLNTVYSRLRRAKALLRAAMAAHGDERSEAEPIAMLEDIDAWASRSR